MLDTYQDLWAGLHPQSVQVDPFCFLSWVANTQLNHWTKWVARTQLSLAPKNLSRTVAMSSYKSHISES